MTKMEPIAHARLLDAGWYDGRRISLDAVEAAFEREGITLHPLARSIIAEFDGLRIRFPKWSTGALDVLALDAAAEAMQMYEALVEYEKQLAMILAPIGSVYHDHAAVFVSGSGEIIGAYDACVFRLGTDFGDALNRMCAGEKPTILHE